MSFPDVIAYKKSHPRGWLFLYPPNLADVIVSPVGRITSYLAMLERLVLSLFGTIT